MLVLTRSVGGTIDIGPEIRITVIALDYSNVRLGFTAPEQLAKNHIIWR